MIDRGRAAGPTTVKLGVLAALTALAATLLVATGAAPASAVTKTFTPDGPRRYLDSVTVVSTPRAWRFEVRTKNQPQVIGYEIYIDIGGGEQGPGADYILQSVLGRTRLYESTDGTRGQSRPAHCAAKSTGALAPGKGPGRYFRIPQRCLNYFATDESTVERLRVRVAVIGTPPGQNCRYSWSPRRGRTVFHGWVANDPGAPDFGRTSSAHRRPAVRAAIRSAARRGC